MENLPVKGTVWRHARRVTWDGEPLELTVTSITGGRVYSLDKYRRRVKTPVELFDKLCLEIVSVPAPVASERGPRLERRQCEELFRSAHLAGYAAGEGEVPAPMVVVEHANPLDDNSPVVRVYEPHTEGVCGFAWVNVRPGNSSFARWLVDSGHARKGYHGGVDLWVREFGQSYQRKMAYARAFAQVLQEAGIRAYASGRLD